MIPTKPTYDHIPVIHMRLVVLGLDGKPVTENGPDPSPDAVSRHWAWCEDQEPQLMTLGHGVLHITEADSRDRLRRLFAVDLDETHHAISGVFTREAGCPQPRMGDFLVTQVAHGAALAWNVGFTHDDLPKYLPTPDELILILRPDFGLLGEGGKTLPTATLAPEVTHAIQ